MKKKVLFVDDDRRLIQVYAEAIADLDGVATECFYDPDAILEYLQAGEPADAIVWDMMMVPGKAFADKVLDGGMTTGRYLFEAMLEMRPQAKFVLLTNKDHVDEKTRSIGPLHYCFKPETPPEELAILISRLLEVEQKTQ